MVVGERSCVQRSRIVRTGGAHRSENAGTSSVKHVQNVFAEMPKVSDATLLGVGLVGPKLRACSRRRWTTG